MDNETISAFAFKTGRLIEDLIIKETNNLKEENELLKAKILEFNNILNNNYDPYYYVPDLLRDYQQHFNIVKHTLGKI
jgi:hypothetical protein